MSSIARPVSQSEPESVNVVVMSDYRSLIGSDRSVFDRIMLEDSFVIESVLFGWGWKEDKQALYDMFAEQLNEFFHEIQKPLDREKYDEYAEAMFNVMDRLEPLLFGQDKQYPNGVNYIQITGEVFDVPQPCFVVKIFGNN